MLSILNGLFVVATFEAVLAMLILGFQPLTLLSMLLPPMIVLVIRTLDSVEGH